MRSPGRWQEVVHRVLIWCDLGPALYISGLPHLYIWHSPDLRVAWTLQRASTYGWSRPLVSLAPLGPLTTASSFNSRVGLCEGAKDLEGNLPLALVPVIVPVALGRVVVLSFFTCVQVMSPRDVSGGSSG